MLLAAGLLAGLPLVTDPAGWYVYVPARWLALVAGTAALAATWWWSERWDRGTSTGGIARRRVEWAWCALVATAVLAALLGPAPLTSLLGSTDRSFGAATWLVHGTLAVLAARLVRDRDALATLCRAMVVGLLGVGGVTLAQRGGWDVPAGASSFARPGGPLGNANLLGAYAVLALLVALGVVLDRDERDGWRTVAGLSLVVGTAALAASGSRAAWLAVAVGVGALLLLAARRGLVRPAVALAIAGAALVLGVGFGVSVDAGGRLEDLTGGTAQGRVDTWTRSADAIAGRPLLGWGPEGLAEGLSGSIDDAFEQHYGRRLTPDRAHNGLLDVTATVGFVGLVAYLAVLALTARAARPAVSAGLSRGPRHAVLAPAVAIALVAYLLQQQALFPLADVDALAWLLAGALVGVGSNAVTEPGRPAPGRPLPRTLRSAGVVLAMLVAGALVLSAVGGVRADRDARAAADALAAGDATLALARADRALQHDPGQVLHGLLLADAAIATGDAATMAAASRHIEQLRETAVEDGRLELAQARLALAAPVGDGTGLRAASGVVRALLGRDPARSEAWLLRGDLADRLQDRTTAVAAWSRAAELRPRDLAPRLRLLDAYVESSRWRAAERILAEIDRIGAPDSAAGRRDLSLLRARVGAAT